MVHSWIRIELHSYRSRHCSTRPRCAGERAGRVERAGRGDGRDREQGSSPRGGRGEGRPGGNGAPQAFSERRVLVAVLISGFHPRDCRQELEASYHLLAPVLLPALQVPEPAAEAAPEPAPAAEAAPAAPAPAPEAAPAPAPAAPVPGESADAREGGDGGWRKLLGCFWGF